MKIDICCIARKENLTIEDWVKYHKNIGINHIWIYDNNNVEDNSLTIILQEYIANNFVTILNNYKGKTNCQISAYNNFIKKYNKTNICNFVGFLDCDEYITLVNTKYNNINSYFEDVVISCPNICSLFINWEIYGDCENYYYENKPVVERFLTPIHNSPANQHIKSFVKLNILNSKFNGNPHNCASLGYNVYYEDFSKGNNSPFNPNHNIVNCKIRHYVTKSLEEWVYRKHNEFTADSHTQKNI